MKALKISSLLVAIIFVLFNSSCDKIEEPFVELTSSDTTISGGNDTIVNDVRKVLLEDYTGHKCPNCPEAAVEANNLKAKYGEQLIIMTVHAGFYSDPDPSGEFTYDFRTPEGGQLHDYYGFFFFPAGLVNRIKPDWAGFITLGKGDWDQAIGDLVNQPQQASISITNDYNAGSRELKTTIETEFLEDLAGTYHIIVYVIENEIEKPQKSEAGVIEDYVHEHVLRTSMNGAFGTPVGNQGTALTGQVYTDNFTITLDTEWVPENCEVIAVVTQHDHETRQVIQAEMADLGL